MNQKKTFFRILGFESLYMMILTLTATLSALLQTAFAKYSGHYSSFIFSGTNYKYNNPMYMLGVVIYFGIAFLLYKILFEKHFKRLSDLNIPLRIVLWIVLIIWGVVMVFAEALALFVFILGLSNNLTPGFLLFLTLFGFPAVTLIYLFVMMIMYLKSAKNQ